MAFTLAFSIVQAFLAVVAQSSSTPEQYRGHVLKETFSPSREWVRQELAPQDHEFSLRISMTQPSFSALEDHLYAVSDPSSPRYGQHLSDTQVHELSAPHPDAVPAVDSWLESHGINTADVIRSPSMDWVKCKTSVRTAEKLLNTTYHVWKNAKTGESLVRTTSWSVPAHLDEYIDLVHPTTMFQGTRPLRTTFRWSPADDPETIKGAVETIPSSATTVDPSCNTTITPTCLLQLYNAIDYKVQAHNKGNKIAIASYIGDSASFSDLEMFYQNFRPDAANSSFNAILINGGKENQSASLFELVEGNLDTQYAFSLTFPTPATVFSTGGSPPFKPDAITPNNTNEPYLDWLDAMHKIKYLPQTISTSYGEDEQTVPPSFAKKVCAGFAALGARGVTLLFASGDSGVGDNNPNPANTTCLTNDGKNVTRFMANFPVDCPYVTAVGATTNVPEVASTRFGSGGGFSDYFERPAYQNDAVKPFLKQLGNKYKGLFNPAGRAYPDLSAQGENFAVIIQGKPHKIFGTSASSPTVAGIVSLLNDARIAAGKKPLGFLNPLIYQKGSKAFNDITSGSNPGCGTQGFNATKGWDPVTGLGTPNFKLLKKLVLDY